MDTKATLPENQDFPYPLQSTDYMGLFDFEAFFPFHKMRSLMASNWKVTVHISFVYLMGIFFGQLYMKNREQFKLRRTLIAWNTMLAIFSVAGFLRTFPELLHILWKPNGFFLSICSR